MNRNHQTVDSENGKVRSCEQFFQLWSQHLWELPLSAEPVLMIAEPCHGPSKQLFRMLGATQVLSTATGAEKAKMLSNNLQSTPRWLYQIIR